MLRRSKVLLLCLGILLIAFTTASTVVAEDTLWQIKVVGLGGRFFGVKAIPPATVP